jgi:hypothetical protein
MRDYAEVTRVHCRIAHCQSGDSLGDRGLAHSGIRIGDRAIAALAQWECTMQQSAVAQ